VELPEDGGVVAAQVAFLGKNPEGLTNHLHDDAAVAAEIHVCTEGALGKVRALNQVGHGLERLGEIRCGEEFLLRFFRLGIFAGGGGDFDGRRCGFRARRGRVKFAKGEGIEAHELAFRRAELDGVFHDLGDDTGNTADVHMQAEGGFGETGVDDQFGDEAGRRIEIRHQDWAGGGGRGSSGRRGFGVRRCEHQLRIVAGRKRNSEWFFRAWRRGV